MIIILYVLAIYWLISTYMKLNGTDEASINFQRKTEERIQNMKLLRTVKDFKGVLLLGIAVGIVLIIVTILKFAHLT